MPATRFQVVIDCADPARLGAFWAEALGYREDPPPAGFESWEAWLRSARIPESEWNNAYAVSDPDGGGPRIFFQRVPEAKTVKNRLHLDLNVGGGRIVPPDGRKQRIEAEAERLVDLGAVRKGSHDERGSFFIAMLDPEGNEFDLQ